MQEIIIKLDYSQLSEDIEKKLDQINLKLDNQLVKLEAQDKKLDAILLKLNELEIPEVPTDPEKPVDPPVVVPPSGYKNIQEEWYRKLNDPSVSEIIIDGKCEVPFIKTTVLNRKLTIKGINNAILKFGIENYNKWTAADQQDGTLFTLENGAEILITDINICQPPQLKNMVEPWRPGLFYSKPDPNIKWTAVVKNCDTTIIGRNGGFGLGFVYGGFHENHIAAVNYKHAGSTFIDAKASIGGSQDTILYLTLDNVLTDGSNEEEFGSWKVKVKAKIKDDVFTIVSDEDFNRIRTMYWTTEEIGNYAYILHADRYTFMFRPENLTDLKTYRMVPTAKGNIRIRVFGGKVYTIGKEGHASDSFLLNGITYNTIEKGRDEFPRWANNDNDPDKEDMVYTPYLTLDKFLPDGYYNVLWTSTLNLPEINDAYLLYKESSYGFRSYSNTPFEYWEIMQGGVIGHNMYNHRRISLWARNVDQRGFYRQTDPGGKSLGYNMVNCSGFKGQFDPRIPITTNVPMPERVKKLI